MNKIKDFAMENKYQSLRNINLGLNIHKIEY